MMHARIVALLLPVVFGALGRANPVPKTNTYDTRRDDAKDEPKISVPLLEIVNGRQINEEEDKDPLAMMWTKTGDKSGDDPLAMMYFKEADASKDEDENDPLAMMWWKPVDDDPDTIEEAES